MKHKDDKIAVQFLIAIAMIALLVLFDNASRDTATLTLKIDDNVRTFKGAIVKDMTILDALNASVMVGGINFKFDIRENKAEIVEIDGMRGDKANPDIFVHLNSERIDTKSINQVVVNPDDQILINVVSKVER